MTEGRREGYWEYMSRRLREEAAREERSKEDVIDILKRIEEKIDRLANVRTD